MARKTSKKGSGKRKRGTPAAKKLARRKSVAKAKKPVAPKPIVVPTVRRPVKNRPAVARMPSPRPAQGTRPRRHLRARSRKERRQLCAPDATAVPRAQRQRLSRPSRAGPRIAAADLGRDLRTLPPARLGAREGRDRSRRHRGGH